MKQLFWFLCFFSTILAEDKPSVNPTAASIGANQKDVILIEPAKRAQDFVQAYEIIKKGKSPQSIFFHTSDGKTISNVLEMTPMSNGTLILFKLTTNMGAKYELIPIENLMSISQI